MKRSPIALSALLVLAACSDDSKSKPAALPDENVFGRFIGFTADGEITADEGYALERTLRPASCDQWKYGELIPEIREGDSVVTDRVSSGDGSMQLRERITVERLSPTAYVLKREALESHLQHAVFSGTLYSREPVRTTCLQKQQGGSATWDCKEEDYKYSKEAQAALARLGGGGSSERVTTECTSEGSSDRSTSTVLKGTYKGADGIAREALLRKSKYIRKQVCKRDGKVISEEEATSFHSDLIVKGALIVASPQHACYARVISEYAEYGGNGRLKWRSLETANGYRLVD